MGKNFVQGEKFKRFFPCGHLSVFVVASISSFLTGEKILMGCINQDKADTCWLYVDLLQKMYADTHLRH
jgi:hypothetical protein